MLYSSGKKLNQNFVIANKPMLKVQGFIQLYTYCIRSSSVHINFVLGLSILYKATGIVTLYLFKYLQ